MTESIVTGRLSRAGLEAVGAAAAFFLWRPALETGSLDAVLQAELSVQSPTQTRVHFVDLAEQTRQLEPALTAAWHEVLSRGDFVLGEAVARFESQFAAYCGVEHAVGVDSGFSALELAIRAAGCRPGDEIITQANTYVATVSAIQAVGARPVLADCDAAGNIDPNAVRAAISSRTAALIPVHMFGRLVEIGPLTDLAVEHGVLLLEDACQAHGATWDDGRRAGSVGIAAAFSFYPAKNLGAFGDGGALVTRSAAIADEARAVRNYGQRAKYVHERTPLNRRLDTLQAAVLSIKLAHLDRWNRRRRLIAEAYRERLADLPIVLPPSDPAGRHVYHLFVIQVDARDRLRSALDAEGIDTGIHYPIPVHRLPAMAELGYRSGAFPNAERLAATSLSLPMYPELPMSQVERVSEAIRRFFEG